MFQNPFTTTTQKNIGRVFVALTAALIMAAAPAEAWVQSKLPTFADDSRTPHHGGNKAPVALGGNSLLAATANGGTIEFWWSGNEGADWSRDAIVRADTDSVVVLSNNLALSWGKGVAPALHTNPGGTPGGWTANVQAWPLANWNILDVAVSASGEALVLATTPAAGKLVEGPLYLLRGSAAGWSAPVQLSVGLVGDAAIAVHSTGLIDILWSERAANLWNIKLASSGNGATYSAATTAVANISAPKFQESAVQIAVDDLPGEQVALAYTGWFARPHSQLASLAIDGRTGSVTAAAALLPDAGDMVYQPAVESIGAGQWAVVWQQKLDIDCEIYLAQRQATGLWSRAVNISADPLHVDRDPHLSHGNGSPLAIAYTKRTIPSAQEEYLLATGSILDLPLDRDGDGVADALEAGFDANRNGIDDSLEATVASWNTPEGRYSLEVLGGGVLTNVQAISFAHTGMANPPGRSVLGRMFGFEIGNLPLGASVQVHIRTPQQLAANAQWLKWGTLGWTPYANMLLDADLSGLTIALTDGGMGDDDGLINGSIKDPAVIAQPQTTTATAPAAAAPTAGGSGGGGCIAPASGNPLPLVAPMLLLLALAAMARKTNG